MSTFSLPTEAPQSATSAARHPRRTDQQRGRGRGRGEVPSRPPRKRFWWEGGNKGWKRGSRSPLKTSCCRGSAKRANVVFTRASRTVANTPRLGVCVCVCARVRVCPGPAGAEHQAVAPLSDQPISVCRRRFPPERRSPKQRSSLSPSGGKVYRRLAFVVGLKRIAAVSV